MNKKGLNEVVSLVLFILLILVLVGILYYFVSPTVTEGGQQLDPAAACLKVQVEPVSCNYAYCSFDSNLWAMIKVRRNAADVEISDIRYAVTDENGKTYVKDHRSGVNPLYQEPLPSPNGYALKGIAMVPLPAEYGTPTSVTVTPIIGTGANRVVCPPVTQEISCTNFANPFGRCADCDNSRVLANTTVVLTANDFQCYINEAALNPTGYADFDGDGRITSADFVGFCVAYDANDCSSCPTHEGSLRCDRHLSA